MMVHKATRLLAVSVGASLALSACGGGGDAQGVTNEGGQKPLVAAVETSYPPIGYIDPQSGENVGFLVDLLNAMSEDMGREIKFVESEFEQLIPSVQTGRIDIVAGGMTDTEERRELIDFVDYIATGPQPFTVPDKEAQLKTLEDMCGEQVGAPSFTNYVAQLEELSNEICPENLPIDVVGTEGADATTTQLKQGRRNVGVLGAEYVAHLVAELQPGEFVKFAEPFSEDYFGIGFSKDDTEVRDAFAESLANLIEDGTYEKILADWKMQDLSIDQVRINGEPVEQ